MLAKIFNTVKIHCECHSDPETLLLWGLCTGCKKHFTDKLYCHSRARLLTLGSGWLSRKILSLLPLVDTKTTTTYRTAIFENNLKTSRMDILQLRI